MKQNYFSNMVSVAPILILTNNFIDSGQKNASDYFMVCFLFDFSTIYKGPRGIWI